MNINFYRINEEKNKINKILTSPITITGKLIDKISIVNPIIEISLNTNISLTNYCYIEAFNRYYFITDITVNDKTMIMSLHCDVLMSFKNDILTSKATIVRTYTGNKYLKDNRIVQTSKINRQVKKIGTGFTTNEKFIVQIGG